MTILERVYETAKSKRARVVFVEWDEPRVAAAVERALAEHLCEPIPVADASDAQMDALVSQRGMKETVAKRMLTRPLYRAAAMVAAGEADAMVAGAVLPTRRVIEAASIGIGLAQGVSLPSSFFLMLFPDGRELLFSDCALNVDPDVDGLCAIARASQASASALLGRADVAMLSFSTGDSGAGPSVDIVRAASEQLGFTGPVQGDAALNSVVAQRKGLGDGRANTLIFPSLDAGNIAYKLCQELAGARALGPVLQGLAKPVCDLSRGANRDEIFDSVAVSLAL